MAWTTGGWEEITIKEPSNAVAELRDFLKFNPPPAEGVFYLHYKMGNLESRIEIDTHDPVTCSVVDRLNGRAVIKPLEQGLTEGLKLAFPKMSINQIIDVTGDMARKAMFSALRRGEAYANTWSERTPEEAIALIKEHRAAQAAVRVTQPEKPVVQYATAARNETSGLRANSLWSKVKGAIHHAPKTPDVENKQEKAVKMPRTK